MFNPRFCIDKRTAAWQTMTLPRSYCTLVIYIFEPNILDAFFVAAVAVAELRRAFATICIVPPSQKTSSWHCTLVSLHISFIRFIFFPTFLAKIFFFAVALRKDACYFKH